MMASQRPRVTFYGTPEIQEWIERESKRLDISVSQLLKQIVIAYKKRKENTKEQQP